MSSTQTKGNFADQASKLALYLSVAALELFVLKYLMLDQNYLVFVEGLSRESYGEIVRVILLPSDYQSEQSKYHYLQVWKEPVDMDSKDVKLSY